MTLTEYLSQEVPVKNPTVFVDKSDLIFSYKHKMADGEARTKVFFKEDYELLAGMEYCLINNTLYTTDRDGNPKNSSVFRLKTK